MTQIVEDDALVAPRRDAGTLRRSHEHLVEPARRRRDRGAGLREHPLRRCADDLVGLPSPRLDRGDSSGVEDDPSSVAALRAIADKSLTLDRVTLPTDMQPIADEIVESERNDLGFARSGHGGETQAERGTVVLLGRGSDERDDLLGLRALRPAVVATRPPTEPNYSIRKPEMALAITSCWICSVPSKMS
jgi:hypothetical protein